MEMRLLKIMGRSAALLKEEETRSKCHIPPKTNSGNERIKCGACNHLLKG